MEVAASVVPQRATSRLSLVPAPGLRPHHASVASRWLCRTSDLAHRHSSVEAIRALQTELAARSTYAGMPTLPEALRELTGLGFELTGMFPVARELDHRRLIELHCVMCRKPPS